MSDHAMPPDLIEIRGIRGFGRHGVFAAVATTSVTFHGSGPSRCMRPSRTILST